MFHTTVRTCRRARHLRQTLLASVISLALTACALGAPTQPQATAPTPTLATLPAASPATSPSTAATSSAPEGNAPEGEEPVVITGTFTYTNDIITDYYVEHAVELFDMYGFVQRDQEWERPVESQVLGYLDLNEDEQQGAFRLLLPAQPSGTPVDLRSRSRADSGVQIFAVAYSPNLIGSPFSVGDDISRGWPGYLASTVNDPEADDEVTGGKLVVWAPDEAQQFPTSFGSDGKLFTDDDPLGPLPPGYSVIDLDQQPFGVLRDAEAELTLYEPNDATVKDYSDLSYTEAFERMFEQVRKEYAFNGVEGKEPDWDALRAELAPRIEEAEQNEDAVAFFRALFDFTRAFKDGHVGLNGGALQARAFGDQMRGGYGFAIRKLDDERVIVTYLVEGGPAAEAGIKIGAEITAFNDQPINEAISAVEPLDGPYSTDFGREYDQLRYLLRAPVGAKATITFQNPDGAAQTVTLEAIEEDESFQASALGFFNPVALPVEYGVLPSGIGVIRVNSNNDDLNLLLRLFERALATFEQYQLPGVIIDMRQNSGGAPLGLAGFLTDQEIMIGQREYYSDETGQFEPSGPPQRVYPSERQYRFERLALLVDQSCYSACELEAYAFSQVPGMIVVGQYPTAGVEAEVSRGQYRLPENISLQVPTGRITTPDGEILLEGVGVEPTVRVPITEETVLSEEDVVLQTAEEELLGQ